MVYQTRPVPPSFVIQIDCNQRIAVLLTSLSTVQYPNPNPGLQQNSFSSLRTISTSLEDFIPLSFLIVRLSSYNQLLPFLMCLTLVYPAFKKHPLIISWSSDFGYNKGLKNKRFNLLSMTISTLPSLSWTRLFRLIKSWSWCVRVNDGKTKKERQSKRAREWKTETSKRDETRRER